jgi:hypothetical protein
MREIWSVHADVEACDIVMRAPGAGRVAPDEVMILGPIADDLRRAVDTVDRDALIRDAAEGWAVVELHVAEAHEIVVRLSALELPDAPGYVQGEVAGVPSRIFVREDGVTILVPASLGAHLDARLEEERP